MTGFAFAKSIDSDKSPELIKRKSALQQESNLSDKAIKERSERSNRGEFKIQTQQMKTEDGEIIEVQIPI